MYSQHFYNVFEFLTSNLFIFLSRSNDAKVDKSHEGKVYPNSESPTFTICIYKEFFRARLIYYRKQYRTVGRMDSLTFSLFHLFPPRFCDLRAQRHLNQFVLWKPPDHNAVCSIACSIKVNPAECHFWDFFVTVWIIGIFFFLRNSINYTLFFNPFLKF